MHALGRKLGRSFTIKHMWIKDTEDMLLTVAGLVIIIGIAFAVLQNRSTANELSHHADIQSEATISQCYQRHAESQGLRNFLVVLFRTPGLKDPVVREALKTYIQQIEDTTPRLSECRQLAIELEVNR